MLVSSTLVIVRCCMVLAIRWHVPDSRRQECIGDIFVVLDSHCECNVRSRLSGSIFATFGGRLDYVCAHLLDGIHSQPPIALKTERCRADPTDLRPFPPSGRVARTARRPDLPRQEDGGTIATSTALFFLGYHFHCSRGFELHSV